MRFYEKTIEIDKELSELDRFTIEFVNTIKKHTEYVIVSGYVSIILGRSRGSEDIDIIIPKMNEEKTKEMIEELLKKRFYCLNTEKDHFEYLNDKVALRFAKEGTVIPNMEMKFAKNKIETIALKNKIRVKIKGKEIYISQLELQIAFKEQILKSPKDIEDAKHIRLVAKGYIDDDLIKEYEGLLHETFNYR